MHPLLSYTPCLSLPHRFSLLVSSISTTNKPTKKTLTNCIYPQIMDLCSTSSSKWNCFASYRLAIDDCKTIHRDSFHRDSWHRSSTKKKSHGGAISHLLPLIFLFQLGFLISQYFDPTPTLQNPKPKKPNNLIPQNHQIQSLITLILIKTIKYQNSHNP